MMRREGHCKGWGGGLAASVALAVAIMAAGAFCTAQAATWTAYVSEQPSSPSGLTGWISADSPAAVQTGDIGVGDTPMFLAANPSGTRVYVPNRFGSGLPTAPARPGVGIRLPISGVGNVSVIDTATNTLLTTIEDSSFDQPVAVAVKPDGSEVWVVNNSSDNVSIIDTSTNLVIGTINDGCFSGATGIVFNPVLHEAYVVGNPEGKNLCIVDTSSHAILDTISLVPTAESVVVTPNGAKVYVTGDDVTIVDTATGNSRTIAPNSLSTVAYLAVSNDGRKVFAASGSNSFLEIIDSSSADFNNDEFIADFTLDFASAVSINAVAVVPGTDVGLVTDTESNEVFAFNTSTDEEIFSDALPVNLTAAPFAIIVIQSGRTATLDIQKDGLGNGWIGSCGMVVGRDGKGPVSAVESAGMMALYFALLLLPVGILKLVHRRKRLPFEKAGIVALFIVASMLVASSAQAERLIAPKAQRFHPTTDGQGALTVDTDQPLCPGQFNLGLTLSGAKKPLDLGNIRELKVEKAIVDELYTADLLVAYGITPDITLGLDIPVDYSRNNLNYADFLRGGNEVRDDVFHLGDIRLNAKFRVIEGNRYGLALIPFANFPTGDKDHLLSEGKFGYGLKLAGHLDVARPVTLYANLGAEQIGKLRTSGDSDYYAPWIQYGVGAKFLLPWRKDSIVAEVNGETSMTTPYAHSTLSPLEVLAAYRTEVAPGWTLQAGGGGGLNKGMGAPQWRAILGIAYKM